MPHYLLMPEGCKWDAIERPQKDLETIYRLECAFISPSTRYAILNRDTGEFKIFNRVLDKKGNIRAVNDITNLAFVDYMPLVWKIESNYATYPDFCNAADIEQEEFEEHIRNKDIMPARMIEKIVAELELLPDEIGMYFYCPLNT